MGKPLREVKDLFLQFDDFFRGQPRFSQPGGQCIPLFLKVLSFQVAPAISKNLDSINREFLNIQ